MNVVGNAANFFLSLSTITHIHTCSVFAGAQTNSMSHHRRMPSTGSSSAARSHAELSHLLETLDMPDTTSDERMFALVQLEHVLSQRVLHDLPLVKQHAQEHGMRRTMFYIQLERCCDWHTYNHGVKTSWAEHLLSLLGRQHLMMSTAPDANSIASEMGCVMSILQGLCLTNDTSRILCSSKSSLALFLAIVKADYSRAHGPNMPAVSLLIPHALDTLMCVLVDAPLDVRRSFEHAHGLSIVRRTLHARPHSDTPDTTSAKCIEFLLFYLQAKEFEQQAAQQISHSTAPLVFQPPEAPPTPKHRRGHARSRSAITATPFYTPLASPRSRHRVVSHGSPTKHVAQVKATPAPDANPFVAKQRERASEQAALMPPAAVFEDDAPTPRRPHLHLDMP